MPVDDQKHSEKIAVWLTEREFLDLNRMALREDRKLSDLARVVLRRFMYGNIAADQQEIHVSNRAE